MLPISRQLMPLLFFFAVLNNCSGNGTKHDGQLLRRGLGGEPSTLDPAAATDNFSYEVLRDLYEGLTTVAPDGEVGPGVAVSWTVDPTGKEYTFKLRADALWSNGSSVRAQDFVNAWRRVVDPKQASPVADDLRVIAGASAIIDGMASPITLGAIATGDSVLVVKLEEPTPYLPQLLTHSAAFPLPPTHSANGRTPRDWTSNGPYVLATWSAGTNIELLKNPNYWDRANVKIEKVEYQIADENSQFARYRANQLDMTDTVPANAIASLRAASPAELAIAPFLATAYYGLNLRVGPFATNLRLRQAVAMAIDRNLLVKALAFGQVAAYGFVPPGTWNYTPQTWLWEDLPDNERISEARLLYEKAGYSIKEPLHIRLLLNSDPVIKNTAIIIARMWKETLGIETELTDEEQRVFLQSRHDKTRWDVARLGWTADFNDASNFLDIFRKHSNNNDFGYEDPTFDELIEKAAHTPDPLDRRGILESSEARMLSNYPVIPLYFYVSKRLVKPYIKGLKLNPLNQVGSKTLSVQAH